MKPLSDANPKLLPIPSKSWKQRYEALSEDAWIAKKCNRSRRLADHRKYIATYCWELPYLEHGLVIDLGLGCGEFLEYARELGHDILGVDSPTGEKGMGSKYVQFCALMHERQQIPVDYEPLAKWIYREHIDKRASVQLVNSRGSIEQMFADYMVGPPHDEHHDCSRLAWKEGVRTIDAFSNFLAVMRLLLTPGGYLVIHANGAKNTDWYDKAIRRAASDIGGLKLCDRWSNRAHKWMKTKAS